MRSSGTVDGSRPSVTTINYLDAIFARAMEKLLARLVILCAHILARICVCVTHSVAASLRACALMPSVFLVFSAANLADGSRSSGTRPSDIAAEPL